MQTELTLNCLSPRESGIVTRLLTVGAMRRRFLDVGLIEGTRVECIGRSPMGDPSAYLIRGAVIAIRAVDCKGIRIRKTEGAETNEGQTNLQTE